jgi:hypothetical protein
MSEILLEGCVGDARTIRTRGEEMNSIVLIRSIDIVYGNATDRSRLAALHYAAAAEE